MTQHADTCPRYARCVRLRTLTVGATSITFPPEPAYCNCGAEPGNVEPLSCAHGRPGGYLCPHCAGTNG